MSWCTPATCSTRQQPTIRATKGHQESVRIYKMGTTMCRYGWPAVGYWHLSAYLNSRLVRVRKPHVVIGNTTHTYHGEDVVSMYITPLTRVLVSPLFWGKSSLTLIIPRSWQSAVQGPTVGVQGQSGSCTTIIPLQTRGWIFSVCAQPPVHSPSVVFVFKAHRLYVSLNSRLESKNIKKDSLSCRLTAPETLNPEP